MALTLIPLKAVLQRIPLSKTEVYRRIKAGTFPKQVRLGPSRVAFVEAEIEKWVQARAYERNHGGGSV